MRNVKDKTYIVPISCREKKTSLTLHRTIWEKPRQGIECMFLRLNKRTGIKIYPDKETAEVAWGRQRRAAKAKIAPQVFSPIMTCDSANLCKIEHIGKSWRGYKFKNRVNPRSPCYFFKTQVAQVKGDKGFKFALEERHKLESKIDALDLSSSDMHTGNIGRIKGRLVCIDFGPEST